MQRYGDRPSGREKDLVDLVVPAELGPAYEKLADSVPYCTDVRRRIDAARDLASALIDRALDGTAVGRTWRATARRWSSP
jgi:hypothetical protein